MIIISRYPRHDRLPWHKGPRYVWCLPPAARHAWRSTEERIFPLRLIMLRCCRRARKIEGRSKSVINISGVKVFPEEIEAVLKNPGIKQARISSKAAPVNGAGYWRRDCGGGRAYCWCGRSDYFCRKRLSSFKAPQHIVDSFTMTGSGKVQRHDGWSGALHAALVERDIHQHQQHAVKYIFEGMV